MSTASRQVSSEISHMPRVYESHIWWYVIYFCLNILCTYMPPTWGSVNTVNWRSGSQLTFSPVWDIFLSHSKPCRAIHFFHRIFYHIPLHQRWTTNTMPYYIAACTVHWNISPKFKTLTCYKFPINIAHFTSMYKICSKLCLMYTKLLTFGCFWGRGGISLLPPLPLLASYKGWFWELLSALP